MHLIPWIGGGGLIRAIKALLSAYRELKGVGVIGSEWYARNGFKRLYELHAAGGPTWSGETVTESLASNLSTVWACRRIISESCSFIPLETMIETASGKFPASGNGAPLHPIAAALKRAPNEEMSAMVFREAMTGNLLMRGNAFALIYRRSGNATAYELEPLDPLQVDLDRDSEKRRVYEVSTGNGSPKTYTVIPGRPHDILHIVGPSVTGRLGEGIVQQARQSIGAVAAAERYAANLWARGVRQPGYLKPERRFPTQQDEDAFLKDLNDKLSGPDGYHKWPLMPVGIEFKPWGWSPQDAQFLAARQYNVPEICRWFLISPDLVGDMSKATLNNIEQLTLRVAKVTLAAWLVRWEQDLWRCILTPQEKASGYYFRHNINGLLRGDYATRMRGYSSALQNGIMNIDEVRDLEDLNPLPAGSGSPYHIQMNMATVPGTGAPMAAEAATLAKAGLQ